MINKKTIRENEKKMKVGQRTHLVELVIGPPARYVAVSGLPMLSSEPTRHRERTWSMDVYGYQQMPCMVSCR